MLRFLSSLFTSPTGDMDGLSADIIDAGIERVVDGTDRRLRAVGGYRKRLREPVETAARHVLGLVDALPSPADISRRGFSTDPRLRALFVSAEHLHERMERCQSLNDYLENFAGSHEEVFGLLTANWKERTVFGMELAGDIVRRDVRQVVVSFSDHRFVGASGTEAEARRELQMRAFDFLVETALERIARETSRNSERKRQCHLLQRKLEAMKAGDWGLETVFSETEHRHPDLESLEAEIESLETELERCGAGSSNLEHNLERVVDTLGRPAEWLVLRPVVFHLDHRGVKVEPSDPAAAGLELTAAFSGPGRHRVVLFGRIPREEIPKRPDFFEQASRYLR